MTKLIVGLLSGYYWASLAYALEEHLIAPRIQAVLNAVRLTWRCLVDTARR